MFYVFLFYIIICNICIYIHICGNSYDSYGDLCIYIVRDHQLSTCIYPSISAHHAQDSAQYRPCLSAVDALQDTARYCKTNCLSSFLVLGSLESLKRISSSFVLLLFILLLWNAFNRGGTPGQGRGGAATMHQGKCLRTSRHLHYGSTALGDSTELIDWVWINYD